ncbi:hypothetical protein [Peptostreptococcus anaerobius]|uniref:Uncharacterized protein n=1 Tax=Peptostreptococcus anaerobius TaxID=1261 RepID=A0A135YZ19_9FIRM|nr:hypothetical protein [Peptostreptococcus anaerobius]KXI14627.1 hypothetical protein HMPREF3195_00148 [Peptostreptococcus anaerobius]
MISEELEKYINEKVEGFKKDLLLDVTKKVDDEKVKTVWDLNTIDYEDYFALGEDGEIKHYIFNSDYDKKVRDMGNAFLTEEEAEFEVERRKVETVLRMYSRPFKYGGGNWFIEFSVNDELIEASYAVYTNIGVPCFETEELANHVINEIGEDRLKKYWFGLE